MATLYYLYSRALTCAPLSVPSHQWDVRSVLEIHVEKQCIGWATSKRRKCTCAISSRNWESLKSLTHKIGEQPPDAEQLRSQLERLAYLGLCVRFHRGTQVASMVEKWTSKIDAIARAAEHARRSATTSTSTPDSPLTPRSTSRQPSQGTQAIPTATSDSASSPERIQPVSAVTPILATSSGLPSPRATPPPGPAYSFRTPSSRTGNTLLPVSSATMAALYDSDEALLQAAVQSPHARRRLASPSTSTLGSLLIPRSPSQESSQRTQAIPTATPDSALSPERIQPVPAVMAASATPSGPPSHRTTLPPGPASPTPRCTRSHASRRSLGDECPICYEGEPLSTFPASALTWCTSSCGRAVHTTCFTAWAEQSVLSGWKLNCPVCRADWTESCACGGRSNCDVVHVARKGMEVPCPVCKEDMKGSSEGTSWCKDGCGQSVHKECMDTWKTHCLTNRKAVSCTMCRAVWTSECEC
jgi:hypothetical protein